eukprot:1726260-Prorocentrum_lima.AAC.1
MDPLMSIHHTSSIQRTAATPEWCSMVDLHHGTLLGMSSELLGIEDSLVHTLVPVEPMVVAEVEELDLSIVG